MYQVSLHYFLVRDFSFFFSEFNESVVSTTDNLTSQLEAGRITEVRNEQRRVRTSSDSQRDPTRQNSIQPSTTALNTAVTFTNRPVITDTNHVSGTNSYHHSSLVVRVVMTSSNTSILTIPPVNRRHHISLNLPNFRQRDISHIIHKYISNKSYGAWRHNKIQ